MITDEMVENARVCLCDSCGNMPSRESVRAALAAALVVQPPCPHIRSSGTGEHATNWCALGGAPAEPSVPVSVLSKMTRDRTGVSMAGFGGGHVAGWNDALRQAIDYAQTNSLRWPHGSLGEECDDLDALRRGLVGPV